MGWEEHDGTIAGAGSEIDVTNLRLLAVKTVGKLVHRSLDHIHPPFARTYHAKSSAWCDSGSKEQS